MEGEQDVTIAGFGRTESAVVSQELKQGCLKIVGRDRCREIYAPIAAKAGYFFQGGVWQGNQLCAIGISH